MRLLELEIQNFGKFHNKRIELQDGVNLIYGENESGKSTIHAFIKAMLFGLERGRGRAAVRDTFSRYEPWENENYYAGKLRFECDGKIFCLQRNFDKYSKKAMLVCETDGEELSVENGDLDMILDGLSKASYENTLCIGQLHVAAGQTLAAELKNYATNYYVTGDSDINLTAAQEILLTKKKAEDRKIKQALFEKQKKRDMMEQEASYIWRDIHHIDSEIESVQAELELRETEEADKSREDEMEAEWGKRRITDILRPAKWRIHPIEVAVILTMIILSFTVIPGPWNSFVTVIVALLGAIYIWNRMKISKNKVKTEPEQLLEEFTSEEELVSTDKLTWKREHLIRQRMEKQVEYDNLQEQLQEMDEMGSEYRESDRKREALLLAVKRLEEVSEDMQRQLTMRLNQRTSEIIAQITGGRYDRLMVDGELHMSILYDGRCVAMEQVSQGTLEQIYFALRMAAFELMYDEKHPLILDDTFAFYDDVRLARTLGWLAECGHQVIIFSCQKREEELMKRNGIHYAKTIL